MGNTKKITLPIKIIIIGCAIGLVIAGIGGIQQFNAVKTNKARRDAALKQSEEAVKVANDRLAEIASEYNNLEAQYNAKANECDAIITGSNGWFENKNRCLSEKQELKSKLFDLETEDSLIKAKDYTVYYQEVRPMSYQIFYIIGAIVAGLALLGAFIIYLVKGKKTY